MNRTQIDELLPQLNAEWRVEGDHHLVRSWILPDFATALARVNAIGALAEAMGHHPDLQLGWGRVHCELYTHAIDGLHLADFVLAAQIDEISG